MLHIMTTATLTLTLCMQMEPVMGTMQKLMAMVTVKEVREAITRMRRTKKRTKDNTTTISVCQLFYGFSTYTSTPWKWQDVHTFTSDLYYTLKYKVNLFLRHQVMINNQYTLKSLNFKNRCIRGTPQFLK